MKIKSFIIAIYTIAGLVIAALSAFMTFIIIDAPIGAKMFMQIVLAITFVLPIIIVISYFFGKYLSNKFADIQAKLKSIEAESFVEDDDIYFMDEIDEINQSMNFLSNRLGSLIKDLKQKNQNLSDLLISMAHDVKTPLTILKGYIEEMEDGILDPTDMPVIFKSMKQEVDFLNELTIDMLGYISSMQNHKQKEEINFHNLLKNEIFPIFPSSQELVLLNEVDKDFIITFNKVDLKKICINLISNAIKHTRNGYINVETKDALVYFENNGEMIPKEYEKKIFEPFFTVSKSKNRKQSGFGLGLSIVKNLCLNNGYDCHLDANNENVVRFVLIRNSHESLK